MPFPHDPRWAPHGTTRARTRPSMILNVGAFFYCIVCFCVTLPMAGITAAVSAWKGIVVLGQGDSKTRRRKST
ncbi:hypothetical protein BC940DRAFT_294863 [Gongronella butleri]|nr:hypothetical protein BC940DRAFT_294863 [Gongronella butleri]